MEIKNSGYNQLLQHMYVANYSELFLLPLPLWGLQQFSSYWRREDKTTSGELRDYDLGNVEPHDLRGCHTWCPTWK
jgi:hypothetical protein